MIIILLLLVILLLTGLKVNQDKSSLFSVEQTVTLKGLGIIVVFFDHLLHYLKESDYQFKSIDLPFVFFVEQTTTLFVSLFLFISGFGVGEAIKKKGSDYIKGMPYKRILTTLLNFDVAILCYILLNTIIGHKMTISEVFFSLLAWDSIGNSNWYIFCIICCYMFSYIGAISSKKSEWGGYIVLLLSIGYSIIMSYLKESWWYNSVLAYSAGMLYSAYKERLNIHIYQNSYLLFVISLFLFVFLYTFNRYPWLMNLASISFCWICIIWSTKFTFESSILSWCGSHLFQLYIYQRVPMIALGIICPSIINKHPYVYTTLCLIVSVLLASIIPQIKTNTFSSKFK